MPRTKRKPTKALSKKISKPARKRTRKAPVNQWRDTWHKGTTWHAKFLNHYSKTLNVTNAARLAGVSRFTVYAHLESDPTFAELFEQARMCLVEQVESKGFDLALKGDAGMIRFLLTHNNIDRYQPPKAVIIITPETLQKLTDEELQLLKAGADPAQILRPDKRRTLRS